MRSSIKNLNGRHGSSVASWCKLTRWRASHVFSISEANFFTKKTGLGVTAAIKQQQRLCRVLGRADLFVEEGVQLLCYDADNGGGGERPRRTSCGVQRRWKRWEKQAASGWSSVRYCACLPILLAPFYLSPLIFGVSHKSTMRLQILGWLCTELTPTLTPDTGRWSSVRHHGTSSILGGE